MHLQTIPTDYLIYHNNRLLVFNQFIDKPRFVYQCVETCGAGLLQTLAGNDFFSVVVDVDIVLAFLMLFDGGLIRNI